MDNVINQLANFRFTENDENVLQENQHPNKPKRLSDLNKMSAEMSVEDTGGSDWTAKQDMDQSESHSDDSQTAADAPSCSSVAARRILPIRNRRSISLKKVQEHTICKKDSNPKLSPSCVKLDLKQVRQLYTKQTLGRFHPTKLETIFEEPRQLKSHESAARDTGLTKVKRAIALPNGCDITKTLRNKRRARVMKFFGRRATLRSIDLSDGGEMRKFMERLESCEHEAFPEGNANLQD